MPLTYNSLVTTIEAYLDRQDASTIQQIPLFIELGQQRLSRETKSLGQVQYVNTQFTVIPVSNPVIQKPGRFRRVLSWQLGNGADMSVRNQLYLRTYEFCRQYWPNPDLTGQPLYYCDYGFYDWLVVPSPDIAYPFEISYLELSIPLSIAVQTNYYTNFAEDVLLYACLVEAIPYLKTDDRISVWLSMYDRALASLNNQDDLRYLARSSNRGAD